MSDEVVRIAALTKYYGKALGVSDLDFAVRPGEVFGFLGPNGAGKTTTIRLMLDLIRPTRGRIELFGLDSHRQSLAARRRIGYVPGELALYERMSARAYLAYFAHLRGMPSLAPAEGIARRLELDLDRPIKALSHGNRRKVALAQALMHDPELLILDEPTAGLDPLMQQVFSELVGEAAAAGRTVFLSSHDLSEVQRVADRVALIREGRLALVEEVEALRRRAFLRVEVTFASVPPVEAFDGIADARELERREGAVVFAVEGEVDPLIKTLGRYRVLSLDSREADLEDVFLTLYRQGPERAAA